MIHNKSYSLKKVVYYLILVIIVSYSCSKKISIKTNSEYFSAEIEGVDFTPCNDKFMGLPPLETRYKPSENSLTIDARNTCDSPMSSVYIELNNIDNSGIYYISTNNIARINYSDRIHETDSIHTGFIEITKFDLKENRISANFEIEAIGRDSITISVLKGVIDNLHLSVNEY